MQKAAKIWFMTLSVALVATACVQDTEPEANLPRTSFKLADGSPVSEAAYDDYNPILLQLSNGYLALVYASTRTCAVSCTNHNIFIASSVSAYNNDGKVPAFNPPQVITANASPINFTTRLRLAGYASGTNINVYVKDTPGQISTTGLISPVSASPINVGALISPIANYYCYSGTLLGLDAAGLMISTASTTGPISRYNPSGGDMCPFNTLSNTTLASAVNISYLRAADIGISEGFFVTDSAGRLTAQTATSNGPVIQSMSDTMTHYGLFLTSATVLKANAASGDLLVFSAAASAGANSDMYIVAGRTPQSLWLKYTQFGAQPKP